MSNASKAWLQQSREALSSVFHARLERQGIQFTLEQVKSICDYFLHLAGAGSLVDVEWGEASIDQRIASVSALRLAAVNLLARNEIAPASEEAIEHINLALDRWLLALEQDRRRHENEELKAQLAQQSDTMQTAMARLEKLERTKSDFISIAAHELKTPLTLVRGYGTILSEDIQGKNRQELVALATGIVQGTERLGEIIDDMIDVASLDAETLDLRREQVYLDKLIYMAIGEVRAHTAERDVVIDVEQPPALPIIEGDSQRLYQVFIRVIGNGVKYTPDGGQIDISFRSLRTAGKTGDQFIEVVFADTGIGIDPDEQEWVFEKFYRIGDPSLHSTSKARFKGAGPGLGLTIARGIVQAHGGMMWVESEGQDEINCPGSEFHIVLPTRVGRRLDGHPGRPAWFENMKLEVDPE